MSEWSARVIEIQTEQGKSGMPAMCKGHLAYHGYGVKGATHVTHIPTGRCVAILEDAETAKELISNLLSLKGLAWEKLDHEEIGITHKVLKAQVARVKRAQSKRRKSEQQAILLAARVE